MTDTAANTTSALPPELQKWWGQSVTIWGAVVSAAAVVLPALAPAIGLDLTPTAIRELGGQLGSLAQILVGLAGTGLTVYGRVRATRSLIQRTIRFRL